MPKSLKMIQKKKTHISQTVTSYGRTTFQAKRPEVDGEENNEEPVTGSFMKKKISEII